MELTKSEKIVRLLNRLIEFNSLCRGCHLKKIEDDPIIVDRDFIPTVEVMGDAVKLISSQEEELENTKKDLFKTGTTVQKQQELITQLNNELQKFKEECTQLRYELYTANYEFDIFTKQLLDSLEELLSKKLTDFNSQNMIFTKEWQLDQYLHNLIKECLPELEVIMNKSPLITNYNVYSVMPMKFYKGSSLVAAESVEEANQIIEELKVTEPDRYAGYNNIKIEDQVVELFSPKKGVLIEGISKEDN